MRHNFNQTNPMEKPQIGPLDDLSNHELYGYINLLDRVNIFTFFIQGVTSIPFMLLLVVIIPGMWYSYSFSIMIQSIIYGLIGLQFGSTMFWIEKLVRRKKVVTEMKERNLPIN